MSSAKRTPRYVDAIRPFDVERTASADVIRLRREIGPALPPITEHWPRTKAVPLARRPYQLLLVPPTPGAPTRTFNVARWHARFVLAAVGALVVVAMAGIATLVVAVRTPEVFTSDETQRLRSRLLVLEDSLARALAEHATAAESLAVVTRTSVATPAARRTTKLMTPGLRAPTRRTGRLADDRSSVASIEGLPVIGRIASRFSRARRHPLLKVVRPHLGVDVAANRGTQITAPAAGRVSFVGRRFGFGLVVEIDHGDGIVTRYAHCGSAFVSKGAHVQRGVPIATVGSSGLASGPHLHYEVLVRGRQVDPLRFKLPQSGTDSATPPAVAGTRTELPPAAASSQTPATGPTVVPAAVPFVMPSALPAAAPPSLAHPALAPGQQP
jgi:murein DD-endopeptidase MepM/ murein hydrolase activator NlpD